MNKKLEINNTGGKWIATLIEYDSLPFGKIPDNTLDSFEANSYIETLQEISSRNWNNLMNKNV